MRPSTVPCPVGDGQRDLFEERVDEKGNRYLAVVGRESIKDFIQASKEGTEISTILKRFSRTGDISILQQRPGFYCDITNLPSNLMEAQNHLIKLQKSFDHLPSDKKLEFDNSFDKFVKEVSSYDAKKFIDVFASGNKHNDTNTGNHNLDPGKEIKEGVEL